VDQIRLLDRAGELPAEGAVSDLMWSDPEEVRTEWMQNPRGAGWVFGNLPVREFLQINKLGLVARAHQLVQEGYRFMFTSPLDLMAVPTAKAEGLLVTVWSAPNYCYRCGNTASLLRMAEGGAKSFEIFREVAASANAPPPRELVPYFI
jgi:diadenosine tetraphosphatase ApaH/serine/threonine PP2A family protein phosphatase